MTNWVLKCWVADLSWEGPEKLDLTASQGPRLKPQEKIGLQPYVAAAFIGMAETEDGKQRLIAPLVDVQSRKLKQGIPLVTEEMAYGKAGKVLCLKPV